jgi:vitamin B12/bleomycin/antimicrobial peptide transport system ATP-binding/permease protein
VGFDVQNATLAPTKQLHSPVSLVQSHHRQYKSAAPYHPELCPAVEHGPRIAMHDVHAPAAAATDVDDPKASLRDPTETARLDALRQDPRRLARLFWTLAKPYWQYAPRAKLDLAWVVFLGLLQSAISVVFSFVSRDFWTALQKKDVAMFWRQIAIFSGLLVLALPIIVWYSYAKEKLALRWRQFHTRKLLGEYFSERNYYEIDQRSDVDNVDQRISEDTSAFTTTSLTLLMTLFMSAIDLVNFSVILMTIYPRLFLVLILYATSGTLITLLIGRRLISLNFTQLQREADFRFSIIRVRENAESIAFYNGEARERHEIERRFTSAVDNFVDLITWSRNLSFFTSLYTYCVQILPLVIIAPLYFKGSIELGVVSQSQQAFRHILDDLSLIVSQFESLSAFAAGIDRLGELEEFLYTRYRENQKLRMLACPDAEGGASSRRHDKDPGFDQSSSASDDDINPDGENSPRSGSRADLERDGVRAARFIRSSMYTTQRAADMAEMELLSAENGNLPTRIKTTICDGSADGDGSGIAIAVDNLTLMTPDTQRRVLFENLNLRLERGQRMLIAGPSGCGKTSTLRALAGLWCIGRGSISRPTFKSMFFLPQKPYCTLGSLREQLCYPLRVSVANKTNSQLQDALNKVDLSTLPARMGGLDETRSWSNVLSLGEQQRLAFARLLVQKPALAILDEASSALDLASEERVYSELRRNGTAYISVGHRPSLLKYHDVLLRIGQGDQGCAVSPITSDMYDSMLAS